MIYLIILIGDKILKMFLMPDLNLVGVNTGLIFGISSNLIITGILSCAVLGMIFLCKGLLTKADVGFKIMILGIIMNISDRMIWGGVVDNIKIFNMLRFNIADVIILIGMSVVIYIFFSNHAKLSIDRK